MSTCPFCKHDPYEYVDIGVGWVPVAVNCCDLGYDLFDPRGNGRLARRVLRQMRSHSPRQKARAMATLREFGIRPERRSVA